MNTNAGVALLIVLMIPAIRSYANHLSPQVSPSPTPQPIAVVTNERCSNSSTTTCHDVLNKFTACLNSSSSIALEDLFLLVQNDGEDTLQVNVTISDIRTAFPEIRISKHQAKKIKILANIEGSPSIILVAGKGTCVIPIRSSGRLSHFYIKYLAHLSPMYGAYFLFFTVLIAGGAWACCRIDKNEEHPDGVRYHELEMGQPDSHSANDVEMAEGWNHDWDDVWEEQDEVKSPNGHQTESLSHHNSKPSDTNGWGNEWDH